MYGWLTEPLGEYRRMKEAGRLPHALLIGVSAGLGADALAAEIARDFLCAEDGRNEPCPCHSCVMMREGTHPDFTVIERGTAASIGVDALRNGTARLAGTPSNGHGKVLLVRQAHLMTVQAANALLKTLEEPAAGTLILLTADSPGSLLPTILSRVARLKITVPGAAALCAFLRGETGEDRDFSAELAVSGMSPLKVLEWHENGVGKRLSECVGLVAAALKGGGDVKKAAEAMDALYREDPAVLHGLLHALLRDAMGFQNGYPAASLKVLRDPEALRAVAAIDPDSLSRAARKAARLKGAGASPNAIRNSPVLALQLISWLELMRGNG